MNQQNRHRRKDREQGDDYGSVLGGRGIEQKGARTHGHGQL